MVDSLWFVLALVLLAVVSVALVLVLVLRRGQPQPQKVQLLEHSNLPPYIKSFPYSAS